jgi:hypothetical protein
VKICGKLKILKFGTSHLDNAAGIVSNLPTGYMQIPFV